MMFGLDSRSANGRCDTNSPPGWVDPLWIDCAQTMHGPGQPYAVNRYVSINVYAYV